MNIRINRFTVVKFLVLVSVFFSNSESKKVKRWISSFLVVHQIPEREIIDFLKTHRP